MQTLPELTYDRKGADIMRQSTKRMLYIAAAVLLCLSLAFSFLFIAADADHDCSHDDGCAVCGMIDVCLHIMKCGITVLLAFIMPVCTFVPTERVTHRTQRRRMPSTLIIMKTELLY